MNTIILHISYTIHGLFIMDVSFFRKMQPLTILEFFLIAEYCSINTWARWLVKEKGKKDSEMYLDAYAMILLQCTKNKNHQKTR